MLSSLTNALGGAFGAFLDLALQAGVALHLGGGVAKK